MGSSEAARRDPEYVLNLAVRKKKEKYVEKCEWENMKFTAFALDVYGQLHSDAIQIVQGIATFAAVNLGVDYKVVLKRFKTQFRWPWLNKFPK